MATNSINFLCQVADCSNDWNKTEKWIKFGEQLNKEAMIPSINEMRYAGRQVVDFGGGIHWFYKLPLR